MDRMHNDLLMRLRRPSTASRHARFRNGACGASMLGVTLSLPVLSLPNGPKGRISGTRAAVSAAPETRLGRVHGAVQGEE